MFKKILVCLDGSSLAEQILPYVIEQALCFHSIVILLRVIKLPGGAVQGAPVLVKEESEPATAKEDEVATYLAKITSLFREKGLDVKSVIISAHKPDAAIITYARENNVGLIALATHGYSTLGQLIWGSVAESVMRKSLLPVLIVKAQE